MYWPLSAGVTRSICVAEVAGAVRAIAQRIAAKPAAIRIRKDGMNSSSWGRTEGTAARAGELLLPERPLEPGRNNYPSILPLSRTPSNRDCCG